MLFSYLKQFFNKVPAKILKKTVDKSTFECYIQFNKCDDQKPVGWKESGESCRLVRGNEGVLLEFILLAVR